MSQIWIDEGSSLSQGISSSCHAKDEIQTDSGNRWHGRTRWETHHLPWHWYSRWIHTWVPCLELFSRWDWSKFVQVIETYGILFPKILCRGRKTQHPSYTTRSQGILETIEAVDGRKCSLQVCLYFLTLGSNVVVYRPWTCHTKENAHMIVYLQWSWSVKPQD